MTVCWIGVGIGIILRITLVSYLTRIANGH
jgi:hypothetical protein